MLTATYALGQAIKYATTLVHRFRPTPPTPPPPPSPTTADPFGIVYGDIIGEGQFGQVVKARMGLGQREYALKVMRRGHQDANSLAELQPWCMSLVHPNIIRCYGYLSIEPEYHMLVMDIHQGDLFDHIRGNERYVVYTFFLYMKLVL